MEDKIKQGVHKKHGDDKDNQCVSRNAVAFGMDSIGGYTRVTCRDDKPLGTDVTQTLMHGDKCYQDQGETSGPFQQDQDNQTAVQGGRNDAIQVTPWRGCTRCETNGDDK